MHTHPELLGLLDAVLDAPGDDGPRLVMADWLEDHGDEAQAEFIRVQCALAQLEAKSGHSKITPLAWSCKCAVCEEAKPLRRRERELLKGHALYWLAALHPAVDPERCEYRQESGHVVEFGGALLGAATFRRGFVASASLTLDAFMAHAAELFAWHPVERVVLVDREPMAGAASLFGWVAGDFPRAARAGLPPPLFLALAGHLSVGMSPERTRWYDSPESANAALSAACVALGRTLARPVREARRAAALHSTSILTGE